MKVALGIAALCALFLVAATVPAMAQGGAFSDVPSDHWAYAAVNELAADGLVIGYPDGLYKGNRAMTRYEFAMAIARIQEKGALKGAQGEPGPAGPAGPATGVAGPAGPPGPAGEGGGLTDRQKQLLKQLEDEFLPELRQIRNDLDELTFRVEDLEAMMGTDKKPAAKLKLSGSTSYRTGLYGTELQYKGGVTTGYDGYGNLDKDAYKASDFTTMVTKVSLAGQVNDNVMVNVTLLAEPRTNSPVEVNEPPAGIGLMDIVRIDEAWAKVNTDFIVPLTVKVGKQYFMVNQGLCIDNSAFALKAVDIGVGAWRNVMLHGIYGALDREALGGGLPAPPGYPATYTEGQDNYSAATLAIPVSGWTVTAAYVHSGIGAQRAWSVGVDGKALDRKIMVEFARADKDYGGASIPDEQNALVAGVDLINTTALTLTGKCGWLDSNFAGGASLSALNPYAAFSPHDIDWVDRPLFLDPANIARGWEANLQYRGLMKGTMPINVRYYDGDRFGTLPGDYVNGDAVWTVSVSKELAQDATATLLYGRREVDTIPGLSGADPIQVLRGELAVKF